jgi:HAD superfamily hydrolase (TIGR01490 family)
MSANLAEPLQQPVRPLPQRRVLAVFDLDGTVTRCDTLIPFLRFAVGDLAFALRLPILLPILAAMALRLLSRQRAKELVIALYLSGMPREKLAALGEAFAAERLPGMVREAALKQIASHRARGHHCVLASASIAPYVAPWARAAGFDDILCTELAYDERGRVSGRFAGPNCRGEEKVRRLQAQFGELDKLTLHGYGDSSADRPFLALCAEANFQPFRENHRNRPADFLKLMRPHQWVKNAFVFVGLLFGHAFTVPSLVLAALAAFGGFCLTASAIYVVNDYADRERDRVHPRKRHRPLASARVTAAAALTLAGVLALCGITLAAFASPIAAALVAFYALMNLAYSFSLKNVVILDVFIIAAGFILRILAGTLGIGIAPSQWLLVCSLFLTLFLGFTKRRSELLSVGGDFLIHRKALLHYNPQLLDKMISVCAAAALMSYSLYTMSPATAQMHGTENLIYTIPFVAYGMFRYLHLLHARQAGGDASREVVKDPHLLVTVLAWGITTVLLIA